MRKEGNPSQLSMLWVKGAWAGKGGGDGSSRHLVFDGRKGPRSATRHHRADSETASPSEALSSTRRCPSTLHAWPVGRKTC